MKKLDSFPMAIVKKTSSHYNKSFHSKIFTLFASSTSEIFSFAKSSPVPYEFCFAFMRDDQGQWFMSEEGIFKVRKWVLDTVRKNPRRIFEFYQSWNKDWKKYLAASSKLLDTNLKPLPDKDLLSNFDNFYNLYVKAGSIAYISDCFMSTGETDWLDELLKEAIAKKPGITDLPGTLRVLTSSPHLSFALEEELSAIKLASLFEKRFKGSLPSLTDLEKKNLLLFNKIKIHERKYFWVRNNYFNVEYVGAGEIYKNIRKLISLARRNRTSNAKIYAEKQGNFMKTQKARKQLLAKLQLGNFYNNLIKVSDLFAKWKDDRKSGVYIGMHHFDQFLQEISRRTKIKKYDLTFLIYPEMEDLMLNRLNVQLKIRQRKQQAFFAVTPRGYYITQGTAADKYFKYRERGQTVVASLNGAIAFPGRAAGPVRIVSTTEDMKQFKQGEILVTNQTTPDYLPVMKKAAAIVTEQGGITSHAAIVSRELKTPCIIGTKIATSVFKNGDRVEVDANKGVIKKL